MKKSEKKTKTFLLDNTVFVSAIKNPKKKPFSLDLILECIRNATIELVGNKYLIEEMKKYKEKFNSSAASELLDLLMEKTKIIELTKEKIQTCIEYFHESQAKDVIHASTCLEANAILITNDKDFETIKKEGIIQVWSITDAIHNLLA